MGKAGQDHDGQMHDQVPTLYLDSETRTQQLRPSTDAARIYEHLICKSTGGNPILPHARDEPPSSPYAAPSPIERLRLTGHIKPTAEMEEPCRAGPISFHLPQSTASGDRHQARHPAPQPNAPEQPICPGPPFHTAAAAAAAHHPPAFARLHLCRCPPQTLKGRGIRAKLRASIEYDADRTAVAPSSDPFFLVSSFPLPRGRLYFPGKQPALHSRSCRR